MTSHLLNSPTGNVGYIRLSQFSQKSDEDMRQALADAGVQKFIAGQAVKKTIVVPGKIVNIVV